MKKIIIGFIISFCCFMCFCEDIEKVHVLDGLSIGYNNNRTSNYMITEIRTDNDEIFIELASDEHTGFLYYKFHLKQGELTPFFVRHFTEDSRFVIKRAKVYSDSDNEVTFILED